MQTIEAGDMWGLSLCGELRKVEVVGEGDVPGWWRCIDMETGVHFLASEQWFIGRAEDAG